MSNKDCRKKKLWEKILVTDCYTDIICDDEWPDCTNLYLYPAPLFLHSVDYLVFSEMYKNVMLLWCSNTGIHCNENEFYLQHVNNWSMKVLYITRGH